MKKIIITLVLLTLGLTNAQNVDLLKQANKCNIDFARNFSDEIISTTKSKYVFFKVTGSNYLSLITFVYIKEGLSDIEKKEIQANIDSYTGRYELRISNALCIHFSFTEVGANPDLEIKGTKEYSFSKVVGKFLDLFPFYQKNIEPTATTEKTTTTAIYSVRKDLEGYFYNFFRSDYDKLWYLVNMSSRLKSGI